MGGGGIGAVTRLPAMLGRVATIDALSLETIAATGIEIYRKGRHADDVRTLFEEECQAAGLTEQQTKSLKMWCFVLAWNSNGPDPDEAEARKTLVQVVEAFIEENRQKADATGKPSS
jgi:hypothetical protein